MSAAALLLGQYMTNSGWCDVCHFIQQPWRGTQTSTT